MLKLLKMPKLPRLPRLRAAGGLGGAAPHHQVALDAEEARVGGEVGHERGRRHHARQPGMNCQTACRYQPDWVDA